MMTAPVRFNDVTNVALIGSGDLMLHTAGLFAGHGIGVAAVLAPRHAAEVLPIGGVPAAAGFEAAGVPVHVVADINDWSGMASEEWTGAGSLALCFGPAWIFSQRVIAAFGWGMINFNGIPVPHYLGGAHYTWQILHGHRKGGCILQVITADVDRGPILRAEYFDLPEHVRTPKDYFEANYRIACAFMKCAISDMVAGVPFEPQDYAAVDPERLYFPRLWTLKNAFIDWSWSGTEIERFCCAFDAPYAGAASFIDEMEVRLADVNLVNTDHAFHPITAGLIVRRREDMAWVAVRDGLLRIGVVRDSEGRNIMPRLKEGRRLHTPAERLEHARTFRPRLGAEGFQKGD